MLPAGSTITFDASLQGTLRLTDGLHISKQLSIRGPGAGRLTVNGNPNNEFGIYVSPTGSVTIAGLAFTSSYLYNAGTLTLINSTISGNTAVFITTRYIGHYLLCWWRHLQRYGREADPHQQHGLGK